MRRNIAVELIESQHLKAVPDQGRQRLGSVSLPLIALVIDQDSDSRAAVVRIEIEQVDSTNI